VRTVRLARHAPLHRSESRTVAVLLRLPRAVNSPCDGIHHTAEKNSRFPSPAFGRGVSRHQLRWSLSGSRCSSNQEDAWRVLPQARIEIVTCENACGCLAASRGRERCERRRYSLNRVCSEERATRGTVVPAIRSRANQVQEPMFAAADIPCLVIWTPGTRPSQTDARWTPCLTWLCVAVQAPLKLSSQHIHDPLIGKQQRASVRGLGHSARRE